MRPVLAALADPGDVAVGPDEDGGRGGDLADDGQFPSLLVVVASTSWTRFAHGTAAVADVLRLISAGRAWWSRRRRGAGGGGGEVESACGGRAGWPAPRS